MTSNYIYIGNKSVREKRETNLTSEILISFGVYVEQALNRKWCFKYQFPGQDALIVSNEDKEKAANIFFIEYLKSLHYSIRWLYENDRHPELIILLEKMKLNDDPNIDKTVEIITRDMKIKIPPSLVRPSTQPSNLSVKGEWESELSTKDYIHLGIAFSQKDQFKNSGESYISGVGFGYSCGYQDGVKSLQPSQPTKGDEGVNPTYEQLKDLWRDIDLITDYADFDVAAKYKMINDAINSFNKNIKP